MNEDQFAEIYGNSAGFFSLSFSVLSAVLGSARHLIGGRLTCIGSPNRAYPSSRLDSGLWELKPKTQVKIMKTTPQHPAINPLALRLGGAI